MDAIQLLKQEHEKAKAMFVQIRQAGGNERAALWKTLKPELKVHEQMEEAALYGPVAQMAESDQALKEWKDHHHDEAGALEALMEEISGLDPSDEAWLEKLDELQQTLEDHIEEEEGDVWPRIEEVWDEAKLAEAGTHMESLKREEMRKAA